MKINKVGMAELVAEQENGLFLVRLIRMLYITYSDIVFYWKWIGKSSII